MTINQQLERAADEDRIVRIYRAGFEDGWVEGRVAILGPEFFAVAVIDSSVRYDGFNCLRYIDVSECELPAPHAGFLDSALQLRRLVQPRAPAIDLTSVSTLLSTAAIAFPVITIHLEMTDPEVAYIGRVVEVSGSQLRLQHITPDAMWEDEVAGHDLCDITRIDMGCSYEDALLLVAGAAAPRRS